MISKVAHTDTEIFYFGLESVDIFVPESHHALLSVHVTPSLSSFGLGSDPQEEGTGVHFSGRKMTS